MRLHFFWVSAFAVSFASTPAFSAPASSAAHTIEPAFHLIGESSPGVEKDAFGSAKELGTPDAWQAFLKAYPSGFYADLARAYLKQQGEQTSASEAELNGAGRGERDNDNTQMREDSDARSQRDRQDQDSRQSQSTERKEQVRGCEEGYYLSNGRCKRRPSTKPGGCPPGTTPVPETDNCVKVKSKPAKQPEFEVSPWTKPGCKTWQKQCGQGVNSACAKYEETCQVN